MGREIKITVTKAAYQEASGFEVIAGTNCGDSDKSGDTGNGGRTVFSLEDLGGTDWCIEITASEYSQVLQKGRLVLICGPKIAKFTLGGSAEAHTLAASLRTAADALESQLGGADPRERYSHGGPNPPETMDNYEADLPRHKYSGSWAELTDEPDQGGEEDDDTEVWEHNGVTQPELRKAIAGAKQKEQRYIVVLKSGTFYEEWTAIFGDVANIELEIRKSLAPEDDGRDEHEIGRIDLKTMSDEQIDAFVSNFPKK